MRLTDSLRILGMTFDAHLMMDDHFVGLATRAQIRQVILRKIGRHRWGVGVGILKIATDSAIGSVLRYETAIMGS